MSEDIKNNGFIYILTNPSFPDYVKIGYAKNVQNRLNQLNKSEALPFAFRIFATYETPNKLTDKELHRLIDNLNPDLRSIEKFDGKPRIREFYAMDPNDAYALLECIAKISGTEDRLTKYNPEGHEITDEQIAEEVKSRLEAFRFSMCNIPIGSEISFVDDPFIKAKVYDDRHIEYNGKITSLSNLAKELKKLERTPQGPLWFMYNGKILSDLRSEMEGK